MKKAMKKAMSLLLCVVMLFGSIPFADAELSLLDELFAIDAEAATDGIYTYTCENGEATITACDVNAAGAIVIPETLGGYPVSNIGDEAFKGCNGITSIMVPETILGIGYAAFDGCTSLGYAELPMNEDYGNHLFMNCGTASKITIGNGMIVCEWNESETTVLDLKKDFEDLSIIEYRLSEIIGLVSEIQLESENSNYKLVDGVLYDSEIKELIIYPTGSEITEYYMPDTVTTVWYYDNAPIYLACAKSLKYIKFGRDFMNEDLTVETLDAAINECISEYGEYLGLYQLYLIPIAMSVPSYAREIEVSAQNPFFYSENGALYLTNNVTDTKIMLAYPACKEEKQVVLDEKTAYNLFTFRNCRNMEFVITDSLTEAVYEDAYTYSENSGEYTAEECNTMAISNIRGFLNDIFFYNTALSFETYETNTYLTSENGVLCDKEGSVIKFPIDSDITFYAFPETFEFALLNYPFISAVGNGLILSGDLLLPPDTAKPENLTVHVPKTVFDDLEGLGEDTEGIIKVVVAFTLNGASVVCSETTPEIDLEGVVEFAACGSKHLGIVDGACGDNLTWSFNGETGELVISGTGDMYDFTTPEVAPWTDYFLYIKSVTVEDGITSIGQYAFGSCVNLETADFSEGLEKIGYAAFVACESLMSVTIPESVTEIGHGAFGHCTGLKTVNYNAADATVKYYDSLDYVFPPFWGCTSLTEINIGSSVKEIPSYAFMNCGIKDVVIPDNVETINNYSFAYNANLETVDIGTGVDWLWSTAFYGCTALKEIAVDSNNAEYTSDEYGALFNKEKTTLYRYPSANDAKSYSVPDTVTAVGGYAFEDAVNLGEITISENVEDIYDYAFSGCANLKTVNFNAADCDVGGELFAGCDSLTTVNIGSSVEEIPNNMFYGVESIETVNISEGVTKIGIGAFKYCNGIEYVTIPASVTVIGSGAFGSCAKLEKINVNADNKIYYSDEFGVLFAKTDVEESLGIILGSNICELIQYPAGNTATAYDIPENTVAISDSAFHNCKNLTYINIPDSVETIGADAFRGSGCYNDETNWVDGILYVDNWLIEAKSSVSVALIQDGTKGIAERAFYYSYGSKLTSVTVPESVKFINSSAFEYCTNLTEIILPETPIYISYEAFYRCGYWKETSNWEDGLLYIGNHLISADFEEVSGDYAIKENTKSIAEYVFLRCEDIGDVLIPSSVEIIGTAAFMGSSARIIVDSQNPCYSSDEFGVLFDKEQTAVIHYPAGNSEETYRIPEGVTCIELGAFDDSISLENIIVPESVKSVGFGAFYGCSGLVSVYYSGTEEEWNEIVIEGWNTDLTNAVIHYKYDYSHIHSYTVSTLKSATCVDEGSEQYTCDECGHAFTKTIPATGDHEEAYPGVVVVEPTVDSYGKKVYKCRVCGMVMNEIIMDKLDPDTSDEPDEPDIPDTPDVTDEPEEPPVETVTDEIIKKPSTTEVKYGETLILHADFTNIPADAQIEWSVEGEGVTIKPSADGKTCAVTSTATGDVTVTAKYVDANGIEHVSEQKIESKASFWQKIVSFFKNLFGINRIIAQAIKLYQ